jgi:methylisocitrate lyase
MWPHARKRSDFTIDARQSKDFIIVARTDARATEGLDSAIERGIQNKKTGADAVFIEAPRSINEMKKIGKSIKAPLVANMIEGGATPLSSVDSLHKMGFNIILYPKFKQKVVNFDQFNDLVELPKFRKLEKKYGFSKRE